MSRKKLYKPDLTKEGCTHWLLKEVMLMVNKDIKPIKTTNPHRGIN